MTRIVCTLLAACATAALGAVQPAAGQTAVTRIGGWSLPTVRERTWQPLTLTEGSFYFEEYAQAMQYSHLRLVRIDALTGKRTVLAEPMQGRFTSIVAMTPNRVVAWDSDKVVLYDRKTWQNLTDIKLADGIYDAAEAPNHELLFLQRRMQTLLITRFDDEDLTFHGQAPGPYQDTTNYDWRMPSARFHDGEVVAAQFRGACLNTRTCYTVDWLGMDGLIKASLELSFPSVANPQCGQAGVVGAASDDVIVHADCTYFLVNGKTRQLRYKIGTPDMAIQRILVLDELLLAVEGPNPIPRGAPYPTAQALLAFDRSTGANLGKIELPFGQVDAVNGDTLAVQLQSNPNPRGSLTVDLFRVNPAWVRRLAGQGVGPRP